MDKVGGAACVILHGRMWPFTVYDVTAERRVDDDKPLKLKHIIESVVL